MSFKAFLLYPGMLTMVGLIAMLGAAIELRVLHKDKSGKEKFRSFVFSTFFTTLFSSLLLKTVSPMKHFLYLDELTAGAYLCALVIALLLAAAKFGLAAAFDRGVRRYSVFACHFVHFCRIFCSNLLGWCSSGADGCESDIANGGNRDRYLSDRV